MTDVKKQKLQDSGLVEWSVFSELIAMDEDEEGFSKSLFQTFVDQFIETFQEIDDNLKNKDLDKLSALGHYLKGSAAALGLVKISSQCERIQNYGHKNNFDNFKLKDSISTSHLSASENDNDPSAKHNDDNQNDDKDDKKDDAIDKTKHLQELTDDSDDFWIALIEDALERARDGFKKSRAALNEYFDDEL